MAFDGTLLHLKNPNNQYVEFPVDKIKAESYDVSPNQRLDTSAGRSTTGVLQRTTCDHTASKIEFETIPLNNFDVAKLNTLLTGCFTNVKQRNISIKYYDPETDSYKTADCYMPDTKYPIRQIVGNTVHYNSIRYAFIEY